jgi:hypothetical protein
MHIGGDHARRLELGGLTARPTPAEHAGSHLVGLRIFSRQARFIR